MAGNDSVWANILVICFVLILVLILRFSKLLEGKRGKIIVSIFAAIVTIYGIGISRWWVLVSHTVSVGDQQAVAGAAYYFMLGDFSMLSQGGYMNLYPQQIGLSALYELIFRVFGGLRYDVIKIFYAVFNGITIFMGYMLTKELFDSRKAEFLYSCLMICCVPFYVFTVYVYGDIPSICFTMILLWFTVKVMHGFKWYYLMGTVFFAIVDVLVRKNALIIVIAVALVLEIGRASCRERV